MFATILTINRNFRQDGPDGQDKVVVEIDRRYMHHTGRSSQTEPILQILFILSAFGCGCRDVVGSALARTAEQLIQFAQTFRRTDFVEALPHFIAGELSGRDE